MENVIIKTVFYAIIGIGLALSGYIVGYRHGGHDFGYLDRVLTGVIIQSETERCERSETPRACYQWHSGLRTAGALGFYADYHDRVSPVARHVFPDQHNSYQKAVQRIFQKTARVGPGKICSGMRETDKEQFAQCREDVLRFLKTAKHRMDTRNSQEALFQQRE